MCFVYCVLCIKRSEGLSNLLQDAFVEAQREDSDIRQQVRRIGNQFLSNVEIGAQEAVYLILQMPLRKCSRDVVYADLNLEDKRTCLIKPWSKLKDLPENSVNVEMASTLKRYKRRPKILEMMCYAISLHGLICIKQRG